MKNLLIILLLIASSSSLLSQETVTKIDIVTPNIYAYDENGGSRWIYPLDSVDVSEFTDAFKDSTEILTVQIYTPQKRVIQYYDVINAFPNSSIYLNYSDMDSTDQSIVDIFIQQIKDL